MDISLENLTGEQKAAILIVAIGVESASNIFKNMNERDIERLSVENSLIAINAMHKMRSIIIGLSIKSDSYFDIGNIDYG